MLKSLLPQSPLSKIEQVMIGCNDFGLSNQSSHPLMGEDLVPTVLFLVASPASGHLRMMATLFPMAPSPPFRCVLSLSLIYPTCLLAGVSVRKLKLFSSIDVKDCQNSDETHPIVSGCNLHRTIACLDDQRPRLHHSEGFVSGDKGTYHHLIGCATSSPCGANCVANQCHHMPTWTMPHHRHADILNPLESVSIVPRTMRLC
ncbi:hypothetical protein CsSME_00015292 [Camellia sinensis var. sinensis]